ncbi:MAG: PhoH family protein, partial [Leuconostoc falkenbergense]
NKGRSVRVKNFGQRQYIQSIRKNDVTFGIGPAGTGKTFLAVVMAIASLKRGEVEKIIITRPAVEAGESLGFLPGDLKEKVDPYMRPIYDAMNTLVGAEQTQRLMDRGVIEIAPLAYMRGRTLDDAFIILDEAQNTTNQQMKMFLTRLGFGSKMIINGDVSQIDLPRGAKSGLIAAQHILKDVNRISFIHFSSADVVRHPVVGLIVNAYEAADAKLAALKKEQKN